MEEEKISFVMFINDSEENYRYFILIGDKQIRGNTVAQIKATVREIMRKEEKKKET